MYAGFDGYLSNRELSEQERYCPHFEGNDILLGSYSTEDVFWEKLGWLFAQGYDLLHCHDYHRIREKMLFACVAGISV